MRRPVDTTYGFILATLLLFVSCGQTNKKVENNEHAVRENLDGYWVLTNYVDDILKTKSIAPHLSKRLTWDAIVVKIYGDSIATHGLGIENKFRLSDNADSLTVIKGLGYYQLSYDKLLKQIRATAINEKSDNHDTIIYYFRRVKALEQRLIAGIDGKPFFKNLEHNFYTFFIDSLISGTYKPLAKSNDFKILELGKADLTSGFKNYNKYSIHDYFGTLHPFDGNDAIIFEDTTITPLRNVPPTNIVFYSWKFNGDTLLLTEMLTENHERYYLGEKTFKLLRTKQHSH
jgi:hypothetical protein